MAPRRSRPAIAAATGRAGDLAIDAAGLPPDEVARLLDARDRVLARRGLDVGDGEPGRVPVMLVDVAGARIGIALAAVAAILPPVRIAIVPGAPPQLLGLFTHDGAIHNLLAIETALGLPAAGPRAESAALVLRRPGARIAFAIDTAIGVVPIAPPADAADDGAPSRFVAGDGDETILLVDGERLVAALGVRGCSREGETN